jgi:hypothetical protein
MINKSLLRIGVLALSIVAVASAKSYDIVLEATTKIGNTQLAKGAYKMKVDGSNAIFTDSQSGKAVTIPVKIDSGTKKYDSTTIDSTKQGDMDQIKTIKLGGSKDQVQFGQ